MKIIKGKIQKAKKVVVYGPEGIGKSTFASQFPDPIFIDTEGSTNGMDVSRTQKPSSWQMLNEQVKEIMTSKLCKTLVIDTFDWAEQLCINSILAKYDKNGIEDFGYGNGYVYEKEEIGRFLNLLQDVADSGINVVLTAHAQLRKFEQPDEMGAYDRWELKLGKKTSSQISPLVKEWADMVFFANYKTYAVACDKEGKRFKAQGGERVMYTAHHPCWDAKNRDGLSDELPFSYEEIAHIFTFAAGGETTTDSIAEIAEDEISRAVDSEPQLPAQNESAQSDLDTSNIPYIPDGIPKALADLMRKYDVSEGDIQLAVSKRGYFPEDTPIANYPKAFIDGVLVGAWNKLYAVIS